MNIPPGSSQRRRSVLFVMAYHGDRELDRFQEILSRWDDLLEMRSPFRFLFVSALDRKPTTAFDHSFLHHEDPPDTKRWKCVALEWARVARHVEESVDCDAWFWWETDVLPVRRDAFDFFLSLWTERCKIAGYRVRDRKWGMKRRINGVALYARDYWSFVKPCFNLDGTFDTRRPYLDAERDRFVELNRWYALVHHEERLRLTPELRLVHGIRDRSLLEQVLGGARRYRVFPGWYRAAVNRANAWRLEFYRPRRYEPER